MYSILKQDELRKLESGMDPADRKFDNSIVDLPFERLIMNSKHEVWIEGNLFKLYSECLGIALGSPVEDAYQDLLVIGDNGGVSGSYEGEEPVEGIPSDELEQIIPSNYIVYNPMEYDPLGSVEDDPFYNTALQEYNIVPGCPKSNFTYSLYAGGDLKVDFSDHTNFSNAQYPEGSFVQYWKFGDGTGSFQDNPTHKFPDYGTYDVSLATFIAGCGCWHVHSTSITILPPYEKEGNEDCPFQEIDPQVNWNNNPLSVQVVAEPNLVEAAPYVSVTNYYFEFYKLDGTLIHDENRGVLNFIYYDFVEEGQYKVKVTATWDNGDCISASEFHEFTIDNSPPPAENCDKYHKFKECYTEDYDGNSYKLKVTDLARGTWGTTPWKKIDGVQKLYRKKPGQWTWKKYHAWQSIHRTGIYYDRDGNTCTTGHYLDDYGPNQSCQSQRWKWWFSSPQSFTNQFGLDEGSVTFNHKVYLHGVMTQDNSTSHCCDCYNEWGHLLFNKNVSLGEN